MVLMVRIEITFRRYRSGGDFSSSGLSLYRSVYFDNFCTVRLVFYFNKHPLTHIRKKKNTNLLNDRNLAVPL